MRIAAVAAFALALLASARPATAQSVASPAPSAAPTATDAPAIALGADVLAASASCRNLNRAARYADSLAKCEMVDRALRAVHGGSQSSMAGIALAGAEMEAFAASDFAGLRRHPQALQTALDAHRRLLDLARDATLDPDVRARVNGLAGYLRQFEAAEHASIGSASLAAPPVTPRPQHAQPARARRPPAHAAGTSSPPPVPVMTP